MKNIFFFSIPLLVLASCGVAPPDVDIWKAVAAGDMQAVDQHIKAGTDINARDQVGNSTPLMVAAIFGQAESAELLLRNGADLNLKNNNGSTAIHLAAFFCQPDVATLLLENGAEINLKDNNGTTPLDVVDVAWSGELEGIYKMVGAMIQQEIDLDRIQRTRGSVAEILKKHGAKLSSEI